MTDDRKVLGAKLREAREYLGLSQDEVARMVGLTRSAISLLESGQRKVDVLELKRLAECYQRPIGDFTGGTDSAIKPVPQSVQHLARAASNLDEGDRVELLRFAEFLRSKTDLKREG